MKPQPISSAPRDGTVILTDYGFVMFMSQKQWGSPVPNGEWVECDPFGHPYHCADNGYWSCTPNLWTPVPEWILSAQD